MQRRERDNKAEELSHCVSKVNYRSLDWSFSGIIHLPHPSHHSVGISIIRPLWLGINWILCHGCQPFIIGRTIAMDMKLSWLEGSEPAFLNPVCQSKLVWGFWQMRLCWFQIHPFYVEKWSFHQICFTKSILLPCTAKELPLLFSSSYYCHSSVKNGPDSTHHSTVINPTCCHFRSVWPRPLSEKSGITSCVSPFFWVLYVRNEVKLPKALFYNFNMTFSLFRKPREILSKWLWSESLPASPLQSLRREATN